VTEKSIRSLAHLQNSASTARVLNLLRLTNLHANDPEHKRRPFFHNRELNRSIILKHRLRRDELELFTDRRQTATKVILPIDCTDLRVGGRSVFVGQPRFEQALASAFGDTWVTDSDDLQMLSFLDELPSLDPFLMREHLRRRGREPARCYFEVSEADTARMLRFVEVEIQRLIDLCFASAEGARTQGGLRLARKILSISVDSDTDPLRVTLKMDRAEYQEGVFCWKGFLYYKWTLAETMPAINRVAEAIATARPRGQVGIDERAYLEKARGSLRRSILRICETARRSLQVYDQAFAKLVDGQPQAFREFLLEAPSRFVDLGERLGAVSHITSFWSFRFPQGRLPVISSEELVDIFTDFEASLAFCDPGRVPTTDETGQAHPARALAT
jgi:hypothetical protein